MKSPLSVLFVQICARVFIEYKPLLGIGVLIL